MQNKEFPCSQCGQLNPIGIYYCIKCGKKFSYTCPECGTNVTPDVKYCANCGAELLWNTPEIPVIKPPETLPDKNELQKDDSKKESPVKKDNKKIMSPVPWIIIFIVIIIVIALLFNIDKIFK